MKNILKKSFLFISIFILYSCSDNTVNNNNGSGSSNLDFDLYLTKYNFSQGRIETYTIKEDGSGKKLVNDSLGVTSVSYRNKIALAGLDTSQLFLARLYTANKDLTGFTRIPTSGYYPVYFIISLSGDKVLFTTEVGNYLCAANSDGTGLIQISGGIFGGGVSPKFSPDGKRIAFFESAPNIVTKLVIVNSNGENKKVLKDSIWTDYGNTLDWSPDGSKIVYQNKIGNTVSKICIIDTSGGSYSVFSDGFNPLWSPAGDKISYLVNVNNGFEDLFLMNSDGSGIRNLTNTLSQHDYYGPWSKDGMKVLYSTYSGNDDERVNIFNFNSNSFTVVCDSTSWAYWKF